MSKLARTAGSVAFFLALAAVNRATSPGDERQYYRQLKKPAFAPPGWLFGVAWTGLNALQIWADQKLLSERTAGRTALLWQRGANWVLYNLFSPAFFNLKSPKAGAAVTFAQAANTLLTIAAARSRAPYLAKALLPAAGWLAFASLLAGKIAADNPRPARPAARGGRRRAPARRKAAGLQPPAV